VRISASSMLSKDDVDKMVRDAQEHADEDKRRRDEVETRNQAEQLSYQAERTLNDLGDKVSSEDKADVESKIASLREALKGSDLEPVRTGLASLTDVLSRVSTKAYQASGERSGNGRREEGARGEGKPGDGKPGEDKPG